MHKTDSFESQKSCLDHFTVTNCRHSTKKVILGDPLDLFVFNSNESFSYNSNKFRQAEQLIFHVLCSLLFILRLVDLSSLAHFYLLGTTIPEMFTSHFLHSFHSVNVFMNWFIEKRLSQSPRLVLLKLEVAWSKCIIGASYDGITFTFYFNYSINGERQLFSRQTQTPSTTLHQFTHERIRIKTVVLLCSFLVNAQHAYIWMCKVYINWMKWNRAFEQVARRK